MRNFYVERKHCVVGFGESVEIDETHLFRRKYHRGDILAFENILIFSIIDRITKNVIVKRVENRTSLTFLSVVNEHVSAGIRIYSDSWRGYSLIRRRFDLVSVNHSIRFVDG
jgi:hypothetical protein